MRRLLPPFRGTLKHALCLPLLVMAALPAAAAPLAPPRLAVAPESFLSYHAGTVHELSQETTLDPAVRRRLSRHFHITGAQMTRYIQNNLVLSRLKKAGTYRVACVRADGSEYYVQSHLPAGTPVFVSRATGKPILKLACGNPMVSALPAALIAKKPLAPPVLAALPTSQADSSLETLPALTLADNSSPDLLTADDLSAPAVVRVSPTLQFLGGGGGSGLSSIFPALAGLGAAVGVFGSRGSNSGNGTPLIPVVPVTPAVPEASSVTSFGLLLVGGSLVVILRRKARPQSA